MKDYRQILETHWGFSQFRELQLNVIQSVAAGKDTLALMPTGGGKSITFQVYSLSREGICLVITPLIALMKDQVESLGRRGIKALKIHSGMSSGEVKITTDNAVWGDYKFLYVSPERLQSEYFLERLSKMNVNLVAVDEAHCISQWGYDFRPSYLNISNVRKLLPDVTILALTATATPKVAVDIQEKLCFREKNLLTMSFRRDNLSYRVRHTENKAGYLVDNLSMVKGSGIIYTRSRKGTHEICELLKKNKISADYYHAGLNSHSRSDKQDKWLSGKTRVIVATNAFGMGIDKADVRFVIHADPPDSLEAYFQEAGRAGRDGKKAAAVLLFNDADKAALKRHVSVSFPEPENIRRIYHSLCNYLKIAEGFGKGQLHAFSLQHFSQAFRFQQSMVYSSLKILQLEGYLEYTEEVDNPSRVYFTVSRDDLYKFQVANASFDDFVKLLLRSYTGLFSGYVIIDEDLLAKRAGITSEMVYNFLKHLRKSRIIDYIPRNNTPYIWFTRERVSPERLKISKANYDFRKKDYKKRVESVINYATSDDVCRSRILLEYFGEAESDPCGSCDVCIKPSAGIKSSEFDALQKQIHELLHEPETYNNLLKKLPYDKVKSSNAIKWLLDNNWIIQLPDGRLLWKKE